jgi:hypothetical protein
MRHLFILYRNDSIVVLSLSRIKKQIETMIAIQRRCPPCLTTLTLRQTEAPAWVFVSSKSTLSACLTRAAMGHCCDDPGAESTIRTHAAREMLIKGIVLHGRTKAVARRGVEGSRELFTLLPALFLLGAHTHTQERRREEKRGARDTARQENIINVGRSSQCYPPGCGVRTRRRRPKPK